MLLLDRSFTQLSYDKPKDEQEMNQRKRVQLRLQLQKRLNTLEAQAQQGPSKPGDRTLPAVGTMTLDQIEASMIKKSMDFYHNNISKVARALGLSRAALYRRLDKFNIPYDPAD